MKAMTRHRPSFLEIRPFRNLARREGSAADCRRHGSLLPRLTPLLLFHFLLLLLLLLLELCQILRRGLAAATNEVERGSSREDPTFFSNLAAEPKMVDRGMLDSPSRLEEPKDFFDKKNFPSNTIAAFSLTRSLSLSVTQTYPRSPASPASTLLQ